jgi:hypothetical protein
MNRSSVEAVLWQVVGLAVLGLFLAPTLGGPAAMPGPRALWFVALPLLAAAIAGRHRLRQGGGVEAPAATAHRRRSGERRGAASARPAPPRRGRRLRAA